MGPEAAPGPEAVLGPEEIQSTYQSELVGTTGSLVILASITSLHHISSGHATIGLDGNQVLKTVAGQWPLNAEQTDFDLLCDIPSKIKNLLITLKWQWIKGHQDDSKQFDKLDPLSQDNVLADGLAKAYLNHLIGQQYKPTMQHFGDKGPSIGIFVVKCTIKSVFINNIIFQNK
jgi:hypothetical protein